MERQGVMNGVFENDVMIGSNGDKELLIKQFDSGYEQYCEWKEDQLRQIVESMNDSIMELINEWKQIECSRLQQNDNGQIMVIIRNIKKNYEEIINKSKQIIKQQQKRYDEMMMKYDGRLQYVRQLKRSRNNIDIREYSGINNYRREIEQYQKDSKQYQIAIDFGPHCFDSIDSKIEIIGMINELNADNNVGKVSVDFYNSNDKWNDEIMKMMMDRYRNVYSIRIDDENEIPRYSMHGLMKQWVQQQPIMKLELYIYGSIEGSNDGYWLMMEYSQMMKYKQYLEYLGYYHESFDQVRIVRREWDVLELVDGNCR